MQRSLQRLKCYLIKVDAEPVSERAFDQSEPSLKLSDTFLETTNFFIRYDHLPPLGVGV